MSETEPKPVRVVDGTARAERQWVDEHAIDRESVFATRRRDQIADLRARRASMTLLERHRHTAEQAARLSTVGAAQVGHSSHSVDRPAGPPSQQTVDFSEADRFIRAGIEMREAILDDAMGLGAMRQIDQMLSEEKDRMILNELVGWTPAEIEVFYRGKLGSAETVRRLRRAYKLRGKDGREVEQRAEQSDAA